MSGASQSPVVGLGATLSSAVGDGEETDRAADAWAVADDAVLAAVKAAVLGEAHTPVRLGKYEVERPLGAGAMGRILLARDPQLDRLVALKIIAPQLADVPEARRRIVREARAMARLSDPNVAQVYEVAEEGPHLFVAMEYVDGQRLGQWLAERARPWAKIVDVLVQAGRGLAAVHAKGLVHRDFKPDNVMLERGGRAKVVDFGLASGSTDFGGLPLSEAGTMESLDANLTATGAWLGTPAYMAPEQWEGSRVDARSDQFSFCVAVYEALAGQRPFGGDTAAQMRHAVLEQRPAPLRGKVRVPRRVEAAILRGLDIDPLQRWPAMEPLLRALSPRARTKTAVIVPMVALGLTAALLSRTGDDACANADAPMDQTWSPAVRDELRSTMEAVPVPWAGPTAVAVAGHLDRASEAWRQASQAVCAAEDAPAEASACLEHHRRRLATTIARLRASGPAGLVSAVSHLELLADARACLQPSATGWIRDHDSDDAVVVSADPEHGESETIARLGLLSIAAGAHGYAETLAQGRDAAARNLAGAQARGDRPAVAYGAWLLGRVALRDGDRGAAEAAFRRAMDVAMEVGETSLRAAATVELVYVVGNDRERTVEAITLANEAESMLAAQGDLPVWTARLAAHRASTLAHAEPPQSKQAAALHERALEILREQLGDDHPDVISALGNLGSALRNTGDLEQARARLEDAIDRGTMVWGADHPRTARLVGTLGLMWMHSGELGRARRQLERSLQVRATALGQDHAEVASARYNLALVQRLQGDHGEAIEQLRRGLQARERARGPDDIGHAEWLLRIGISELARGRVVEARAPLLRALDLCERWGATPNRFANIRVTLARAYAEQDPAKARVLAQMARRAWRDDPSEVANVDAFLATLTEPRRDP